MTKILINVPRLDVPGGVSNYYLVLRPYLPPDREYFEIGAARDELTKLGLIKRAIIDYWNFHRRLSKGDLSLVHLNPSFVRKALIRDAVFLFIARAHSVPVVAFFHGWDVNLQKLVSRRFGALFRLTYGGANGLVVLAEEFRLQLKDMRVQAPVYPLSTLVDDNIFRRRRTVAEASPGSRILYLSRLDYRKGVLEAIQAFAMVKQQLPEATLTIAGDGVERSKAEALVNKMRLRDVQFLGFISGDAKRIAFEEADIFFFPTFFSEGMPTTVLEAMAYGLPVVTRAVGGLKDFFQNGKMGYITDERDPESFAELLLRIVELPDDRNAMGAYNRQYAQANFSASAVADKLERIYSNAIDRH